ncbi:ankyrin repeat domain-containing protein [Legionella steelei]|uniref:ankyrin repeat domain-containing protein n=1 Tax=Legionella steelei TaxID=947033 RepID=UPI001AD196C6|nr:ankyrin repeat domain-containing protein [Legionella steelei]MBN9227356.1 ankyrin repeat domain-containing protein [Legionella steelei]
MYSKYQFFFKPSQKIVSQEQANIAQENYIREPESGWELYSFYFYAMLTYHFNAPNSNFQKIIISTKGNTQFRIIFQKPKNPLGFEKCLEKFDFQYDEIEKSIMNYEISVIDLDQLIEVLNLLHQQNYISEQLLQDITLAISPDNPDLLKLKQAREIDSSEPKMIFPSQQQSLNEDLYASCANENMRLYDMSNILDAGIPPIKSLLKKQATPDSFTNFKTPLMGLIINQPCNNSTKQIAALLLEYNADLNVPDINEQTALHHAASGRNRLWVEYLLAVGADATLTDAWGHTPKQMYLDSCKINQIPIDSKIVDMFEKAETADFRRSIITQ